MSSDLAISIIILIMTITVYLLITLNHARADSPLIYDNPLMGIRFNIPESWNFTIWYGFEKAFCWGINIGCQLALNPNLEAMSFGDTVGLNIIATRGPTFESHCNCSSLKEYVRWHYENVQNHSLLFTFLNDSKTTVGGNNPAWIIEYDIDWLGKTQHHLDILTKENQTYYRINYYADQASFSKFMPVVKQIIDSLKFIPVRQITDAEIPPYVQDFSPKTPSFMKD
jgi:hypothetical protein